MVLIVDFLGLGPFRANTYTSAKHLSTRRQVECFWGELDERGHAKRWRIFINSLGILAHLLRMGAWNLNTLLR